MQMVRTRQALIGSLALAGVMVGAALTPANAQEDPATESAQSLEAVAPEIVRNTVPVESSKDDTVVSSTGDSTVVLNKSAATPVDFSAGGANLSISLPLPAATIEGESGGVVSYTEVDDTKTLVSHQENSALVIATVLGSGDSPTEFSYTYEGVNLQLTSGGDVLGYTPEGDLAVTVALPWAIDARGQDVPTHYVVSGSTLTQVVEHRGAGFAYPIVADPSNFGGNWMYSQIIGDMENGRTVIRVYAQPLNFNTISNDSVWANYTALVPSAYANSRMRDQLICHVRNIGRAKQPWNLEPWRPDVGYEATVAALCNP